jgi:hypothetical protein
MEISGGTTGVSEEASRLKRRGNIVSKIFGIAAIAALSFIGFYYGCKPKPVETAVDEVPFILGKAARLWGQDNLYAARNTLQPYANDPRVAPVLNDYNSVIAEVQEFNGLTVHTPRLGQGQPYAEYKFKEGDTLTELAARMEAAAERIPFDEARVSDPTLCATNYWLDTMWINFGRHDLDHYAIGDTMRLPGYLIQKASKK